MKLSHSQGIILSVLLLFNFFSETNASTVQSCVDNLYKPCLNDILGCVSNVSQCSTTCSSGSDCPSNCCEQGWCIMSIYCEKKQASSTTSESSSEIPSAGSVLVIVLPVTFGFFIIVIICFLFARKITAEKKAQIQAMRLQNNQFNGGQVAGMQNINMQMVQEQMYKQQQVQPQQQSMFGNIDTAGGNQTAYQSNQNMMFNQNQPQPAAQGNIQYI